ncbi:unnamed protein product [Leuciscus chuanchicus]
MGLDGPRHPGGCRSVASDTTETGIIGPIAPFRQPPTIRSTVAPQSQSGWAFCQCQEALSEIIPGLRSSRMLHITSPEETASGKSIVRHQKLSKETWALIVTLYF